VVIPAPQGRYGVLTAAATRPRDFSADDVHFLQAIANVLAAAMERNRTAELMLATQAEFLAAQKIQRKLFPSSVPPLAAFEQGGAWKGLDIAGASFPAQATGGDYFDYLPLLDGSLGIVVGDVSGHGFGPALLMAETRAYLRALARTHSNVGEILTLTNRVLTDDIEESRFITLVFVRLDPRTRTLSYASAGHLTGYVLDAARKVKHLLKSTCLPLGVVADTEFDAGPDIALEPGDVVLLFTDGLEDALSPDNTHFGAGRILDLVRHYQSDSASQTVQNLYHAARAFSQNQPQFDDITAVVVRVPPCP
jgi:serine phosphatase RsbU (regulator of sigma subunit)